MVEILRVLIVDDCAPLRIAPRGIEKSPEALLGYCNFVKSYSVTLSVPQGGVTQNLKEYVDEWTMCFGSNCTPYRGYKRLKTEWYWTRTASYWGVGQSKTTWTHYGHDCTNTYAQNKTSTKFTPQWETSTTTFVYLTTSTSVWVARTEGPVASGLLLTETTTPVIRSGTSFGNAYTSIKWNPR